MTYDSPIGVAPSLIQWGKALGEGKKPVIPIAAKDPSGPIRLSRNECNKNQTLKGLTYRNRRTTD